MTEAPKIGREKREHDRVELGVRVAIYDSVTGRALPKGGKLTNISRSGFSITCDANLSRGSIYDFEFSIGSSPVRLRGRVVRSESFVAYYEVGVKIEKASIPAVSRLNRFLVPHSRKLQGAAVSTALLGAAAICLAAKLFLGFNIFNLVVTFFVAVIFFCVVMPL